MLCVCVCVCLSIVVFAVGSDRPTKITADILRIVEAQMQLDDETTAVQLQKF